jgi:ferredoxin-NADP reductase
MPQPWQKGTVVRIEQEAPATRRYWIQAHGQERFDFRPGQFVTLDLPIGEKPAKRWRSYSIASWPDGSNLFELVIVLLEDGRGTQYIFNEITVGSEFDFRGPLGSFLLPEPIDKDLFLICTGTGIAPFRSMVHHILNKKLAHSNIYLIFGCRTLSDCLYMAELRQLEQKLSKFRYLPTFSREPTNLDPTIRKGYVHSIYEELCGIRDRRIENAGRISLPSDPDDEMNSGEPVNPAYFYLCGWKNMIDEAKMRILNIGYSRKDIHLELYG